MTYCFENQFEFDFQSSIKSKVVEHLNNSNLHWNTIQKTAYNFTITFKINEMHEKTKYSRLHVTLNEKVNVTF
jgi:outer membrane receptor for ferrienterochelin and colicin